MSGLLVTSLFILLGVSTFVMGKGAWQEDGTYIGKYPAGCQIDSDCPQDEFCVDDIEEVKCPKGGTQCRCMLGCMFKERYLRFEQYRQIEKQTCKCKTPKNNQCYCVDKTFDEFTSDPRNLV